MSPTFTRPRPSGMTFDEAVDALRSIGADPRMNGHGMRARCPVHVGDGPNLALRPGDNGANWVAYCHSSCGGAAAFHRDLVGRLRALDPMPPASPNGKHGASTSGLGRAVACYLYVPYGQEEPAWRKTRYETSAGGKSFGWERRSAIGGGTWIAGLNRQPLGQLPVFGWQTLDLPGPVYWVEGEKSAERAHGLGVPSLTSAGGAKGPLPDDLAMVKGRDVVIVVDRDKEGLAYALKVRSRLEQLDCKVRLAQSKTTGAKADLVDHLDAGFGLDDLDFGPAPEGAEEEVERKFRATLLSTVTPERVRWLWPGRIPLGKVTVLDGDPGVGKSTLAITFAAHITRGRAWPDGSPCPPGAVLLLSGEDALADTVRPRLDAAEGDPSKVLALEGVLVHVDEEVVERDPHLGDVTTIESAINTHGITLVIVDVLMAYLPSGTDSHKDQDIRAVLRRLKDVAERTGAAILLLRHLNKAPGGSPLYRGGGSIGIVGAARSGMLAARDPDDETLCVLASLKNNLAPTPPALSYRISDHDGVGRIEWAGPSERSAHDLLANSDPGDREEREERDALGSFIVDYLEVRGGQAPARDCQKAIREAFGQVAKSTEKRARDRAGVVAKRVGFGDKGVWTWSIDEPIGSTEPPKDSKGSATQGPGTYGTNEEPMEEPTSGANGPRCVTCGRVNPHRYGEGGSPQCDDCRAGAR